MPRQTVTEIIDTPQGKRLRITEMDSRQQEVDAGMLERLIENLDRRITDREAELARLRAERDDLVDKLAQLDERPKGA